MSFGILNEAYVRLSRTGPEWGDDQLTNHGPMAAEVLVRRGRGDLVHRWVDADAFAHSGDADTLAAALRVAELIESRN